MKTKNAKLTFEKSSVTELNNQQLNVVVGGNSSWVCGYLSGKAVDAFIEAYVDHMNDGSGYTGAMDQHGKL